jgi:micrococcal nuclease
MVPILEARPPPVTPLGTPGDPLGTGWYRAPFGTAPRLHPTLLRGYARGLLPAPTDASMSRRSHLSTPPAPGRHVARAAVLVTLLTLGAGTALAALQSPVPGAQGAIVDSRTTERALTKPTETFPVTRVIDGDTLWVERAGQTEKLRLLSVDTEERLELGDSLSATKPGTPFGTACEQWAQQYFADLGRDGQPARVGLVFPGGVEQRDVYGRLLCHLVLADGTDFNLLLVREGKSPYFDKYGYSDVDHAGFVAAEAAAQAAQKGIWHPDTNAGATRRPYDRLLPWWEARAQAVEGFKALHTKAPTAVVSAEVPEELEAALAAAHPRVEVFGSIFQFFDEDDGSLTVLFRGGDKQRSVRVRIPAEERASYASLDLVATTEEFVQNYLYVAGRLTRGARGFELVGVRPRDWRRGGPEPVYPAAATGPAERNTQKGATIGAGAGR